MSQIHEIANDIKKALLSDREYDPVVIYLRPGQLCELGAYGILTISPRRKNPYRVKSANSPVGFYFSLDDVDEISGHNIYVKRLLRRVV